MKGRGRGDVQDVAAAARDHRGQEELGQVRERDDVDLQQVEFRLQIGLDEQSVAAYPGVVDERVNVGALRPQPVEDFPRRFRAREVGGQHAGADVVLAAQLLGKPRELVAAARDEDEVVAVRREQARKLKAYAAGRARDERRHLPSARSHLLFAHCTPQEMMNAE